MEPTHLAKLLGVASFPTPVHFSHMLQSLAGITKSALCCAANLSYAALQLNNDLQFSHSVYGLGSGMPCSLLLSAGHLLHNFELPIAVMTWLLALTDALTVC